MSWGPVNKHLSTVGRKNSLWTGRNRQQSQAQQGAAICHDQLTLDYHTFSFNFFLWVLPCISLFHAQVSLSAFFPSGRYTKNFLAVSAGVLSQSSSNSSLPPTACFPLFLLLTSKSQTTIWQLDVPRLAAFPVPTFQSPLPDQTFCQRCSETMCNFLHSYMLYVISLPSFSLIASSLSSSIVFGQQ